MPTIDEVLSSLTPDQILDHVGRERISGRLGSLIRLYKRIQNRFPDTYLSPQLARLCVESYYADIFRVRVFHDSNLANEYRKAAFTMKWIAKFRPIQLERDCVVEEKHLFANEFFAIAAGLQQLGDVRAEDVPRDFLNRLAYSLLYRPIYGETLTNTMLLLDKTRKKKPKKKSAQPQG